MLYILALALVVPSSSAVIDHLDFFFEAVKAENIKNASSRVRYQENALHIQIMFCDRLKKNTNVRI